MSHWPDKCPTIELPVSQNFSIELPKLKAGQKPTQYSEWTTAQLRKNSH